MIVIHLTINLTLPVLQDRQRPTSVNQAIVDSLKPPPELQAMMHRVDCPLCSKWTQWYETPAKAKQGLGGHQSWCRRKTCKQEL